MCNVYLVNKYKQAPHPPTQRNPPMGRLLSSQPLYIVYDLWCHLLFGITPSYNFYLKMQLRLLVFKQTIWPSFVKNEVFYEDIKALCDFK
jgi:hypothetical protein